MPACRGLVLRAACLSEEVYVDEESADLAVARACRAWAISGESLDQSPTIGGNLSLRKVNIQMNIPSLDIS